MLESLGYEVLQAAGAPAALAQLGAQPVDLVLTDLRMPGMSGRDLLGEIRRAHPILPVVVMTAFTTVRDAVQTIKDGAFDYIGKPIEMEELEATVANALRLHDACATTTGCAASWRGATALRGWSASRPPCRR